MRPIGLGVGTAHRTLTEQLREECKQLWGASSEFYFRIDELLRELANPNLHDIPTRLVAAYYWLSIGWVLRRGRRDL
jgi:hypothetical protein